jgi:hypothetical protein
MYTKWSAHSIGKFLRTDLILPWKHLNSFRQSRTSLDGHLEPKSEVVDVHAAISCQQWLVGKDPEMGAAARLFECRLDPILAQFPLQLQQIPEGVSVIRVNGDPQRCVRGLRA